MEMALAAPLCRSSFKRNGFVICEKFIAKQTADKLNQRLERILQGHHSDGNIASRPDKAPSPVKNSNTKSKKTLQVVNIWKADRAFADIVTSRELGKIVAYLGNWKGARIANDQVWCKPPGAAALTFHRDSAYFDFEPNHVITVWIALDDMDPEVGPLRYVHGSHLWGGGRVGSASLFFGKGQKSTYSMLYDAARRQGISNPEAELEFTTVGVRAGGMAIHDGLTWHGSEKNNSDTNPRRGLGIHFIPSDARLRVPHGKSIAHGVMASMGGSSCHLCAEHFPVTYEYSEE